MSAVLQPPPERRPLSRQSWPQALALGAALGSAALLGAATATSLGPDPVSAALPPEPEPAEARSLLQVSDGLTAAPFRIIELHGQGQLSTAQAVDALRRATEQALAGWAALSQDGRREQPAVHVRLIAQATPQVQTLAQLLERLEDSLNQDDDAQTQRLLAHHLAPASRDLLPALRALAREQPLKPGAAAPAPAAALHPLTWLPVGGLLLGALGLLLMRRPARAQPAQPLDDGSWRRLLDTPDPERALARLLQHLVDSQAVDMACEARFLDSADPLAPPRLVVRHAASRDGLPAPPQAGDLLLLPGREALYPRLRSGQPQELGGSLSDLGTTFAWPGYAHCSRALLLPLWRGGEWHGCLALFSCTTHAFAAGRRERLLALADALSLRLGRPASAVLARSAP